MRLASSMGMSRDAFRHRVLRIAFPVLVSSMIISALSLQALGAWHVYRSLAGDGDATAAQQCALPPSVELPISESLMSDHHPFSTQPPEPERPQPSPPVDVDLRELRAAPLCDFAEVILIAASPDPRWSIAAVRTDGVASLQRRGDDIAGYAVEAIAWDSVSLLRNGERCRMQLGVAKPAAASLRARPVSQPNHSALLSELDALVQQTDAGEVVVDRRAIDLVSANFGELWSGARARRVDGGFELARLPKGGILEKLGLRRGDVVHTINGFDISDNQKMLEAYGRVPHAERITVTFSRGARAMAIDLAIR